MSAAKISCTGASFGAVTLAVVRKDLRLEWRTREVFSATVVFAALVLVTFNFSFEPGQGAVERMASGFIWVAFVFAGMLGLNRTFVTEKEEGCLDALFLSPADPGAIYLGKVIANLIFLAVTEAAVLPLFALLFNFPLARAFPTMLLPLALGSFGFVAAGTLFAAMAAQTRIREVMLPLLLLPACVPVLIASVRLTQAALEGLDLESVLPWVGMLVLCDALFVVAGTFLFQHVLEE
ncbi:MAG: heme exporter protein CcmB [Deltaproteobacteria bacterium]|nr:heme exporter protein CcmB [Deltaproteobacteria bacterium]